MSTVLYPYPLPFQRQQLTLELSAENLEINRDGRTVDLSARNAADREPLRLTATVTLPRPEGRDTPTLTVQVVTHCRSTNLRRVSVATLQDAEKGSRVRTYVAEVEFSPSEVARVVTVEAVVAGRVEKRDHRVLSVAEPWTLHLEKSTLPFQGGGLPVQWVDFGVRPELQPYRQQPFYLDLSDLPTVLLNSSFVGLPEILPDRGRPGRPLLAMHELLLVRIAGTAWQAMFESAVAAIGGTDEDPVEPEAHWQSAVLRRVLELVYPDLGTVEERLREVQREVQSGSTGALHSRAVSAISQSVLQEGKAIRTALQALNFSEETQ